MEYDKKKVTKLKEKCGNTKFVMNGNYKKLTPDYVILALYQMSNRARWYH